VLPGAPRKRFDQLPNFTIPREDSDSSLGSEEAMWPRSRRSLFRTPAARFATSTEAHVSSQTHTPTQTQNISAGAAAAATAEDSKCVSSEFLTGESVILVRIEQVRDSMLVQLALDAFFLFVAWAPFTFYGALLFVVAQRAALVAGERYLLHGQIKCVTGH
jgi:hypothetical protein